MISGRLVAGPDSTGVEVVAAGLEDTEVAGADVVGAVAPEPDEHAASATTRAANPGSNP
jgi:hypothetical protein